LSIGHDPSGGGENRPRVTTPRAGKTDVVKIANRPTNSDAAQGGAPQPGPPWRATGVAPGEIDAQTAAALDASAHGVMKKIFLNRYPTTRRRPPPPGLFRVGHFPRRRSL
jgi:hypothetical protein